MTKDFKLELIERLERDVPELKDKIQPGAVDANTTAPYAAYTVPDEVPIRTCNGIAGYNTTFDLAVYDMKVSTVETLRHKVIKSLDGAKLSGRRCLLKSAAYGFYTDYEIHGYTLTFKII